MYLPVFLLALVPVLALIAGAATAAVLAGRRIYRRYVWAHATDRSTTDVLRVVSLMPHGRAEILLDVPLDQPAYITFTVNHLAVWRADPGMYQGLVSGSGWGPQPAAIRIPRPLTEEVRARAALTAAFATVASHENLHLDIDTDTWEPGILSRAARGLRPKGNQHR